MTGFGAADAQWEAWICQVEIRSVNQRFLDIRCRLPLGFQTMEPEIKKQIKAVSSRGKIDCSIKLEKGASEEKLNLGMRMSDHRSEGGGKNTVLPPDTIAPEGGGENTEMFAPLIQAAITTDDTSEGGGEIVDRIHDSSHLMGQWTTEVEQRPQPLTMRNG